MYNRFFAVGTPGARPTLQVRSVSRVAAKVLDVAGLMDLELGHPEFDKGFQVTTDNEQFARDVLNVDTTHWLLQDQRARDMPFRFERNELVTWQRGRLAASSIDPALNYLCDILDRVPVTVWR